MEPIRQYTGYREIYIPNVTANKFASVLRERFYAEIIHALDETQINGLRMHYDGTLDFIEPLAAGFYCRNVIGQKLWTTWTLYLRGDIQNSAYLRVSDSFVTQASDIHECYLKMAILIATHMIEELAKLQSETHQEMVDRAWNIGLATRKRNLALSLLSKLKGIDVD